MKFVIYRFKNGRKLAVMTVKKEARAVELCAIYEDMESETGVSYSYEEVA